MALDVLQCKAVAQVTFISTVGLGYISFTLLLYFFLNYLISVSTTFFSSLHSFFFFFFISSCLGQGVLLLCLPLLFLSFYHDCGLRLCETFNFSFSTFTFLFEIYVAFTLTIRFYPLFITILIVPFSHFSLLF